MRSYETTYAGLFDLLVDGEPIVRHVEIPMIQRDYAQGRGSDEILNMRRNFLRVLHEAATGGQPVSLDFVYGEVERGKLQPLDGQQRLTALFLLHWYLAARTGRIDDEGGWKHFTYETRPSARDFCDQLVTVSLPDLEVSPSVWLSDQHWFLPTWNYDPTVTSMLVVIDDLAELLAGDDLDAAWDRLHAVQPAIWFHLLPIEDMGAPEELYIKMNSRGRPLTDFENLKALLEKAVDGSAIAHDRKLADKLDGRWLDLMWPLRNDEHKVDNEFLNYIRFVIELCELRRKDLEASKLSLIERTERAFTAGTDEAENNIEFLLDAFDVWVPEDDPTFAVAGFFDAIFATSLPELGTAGNKVVVFAQDPNPNLFPVCCRHYGNEQRFGSRIKLLLYAVLLHRIHHTDDFPRRLRLVRNFVEASEDELRLEQLPAAAADVMRIIVDGDLEGVSGLNSVQRDDELEKRGFLAENRDLEQVVFHLEDHELLRGSLVAFKLDVEHLGQRAALFESVFTGDGSLIDFTGALLATGDYHRALGRNVTSFKFGAPRPSRWWREFLTGASREELEPVATTLSELLDRLSAPAGPTAEELQAIQHEWLEVREADLLLDWRYYMVKYSAMRSGASGIYRSDNNELGYSLYMLEGANLRGHSRDPYLEAILGLTGASAAVTSTTRSLILNTSETELWSAEIGFAIKPPLLDKHRALFEEVRAGRGDVIDSVNEEGGLVLRVRQQDHDGVAIDSVDRIETGAVFLSQLLDAGL